ncbi:ATP-binding protein [Gellertiella hungarica]|uniref:AAA+ ATPase domain-containing protein n=1 Tax=Gellertiella hungarica TaxID=1572859 RepID=A0A7W6J3S3_9HYPH|nr:ATP-binding protein [Gellertiella hungarica]MBB4064249.1 hypothetical protein [Gellertiella hungarica]
MDKLTRLFIKRLQQDVRRRTLRNALLSGLLELKLAEHDGHLLKRFSPAFDTSQLSGHLDEDVAWVKKHFASFLIEPPNAQEASLVANASHGASVDVLPPVPDRLKLLFRRKLETAAWPVADEARRAYAVRLVAAAGEAPASGHVVTAILLARAFAQSGRTVSDWMRVLRAGTSFICIQSDVEGFERHLMRLLEHTGLLAGNRLSLIDGGAPFRDCDLGLDDRGPYRPVMHMDGRDAARLTGPSLRRRMVDAAARDLPVLLTADDPERLPEQVLLASDLRLVIMKPDRDLLVDIIEAIYGVPAMEELKRSPLRFSPRWLSVEELILAFRPTRRLADAMRIVEALARQNRQAAGETDDADDECWDDEQDGAVKPHNRQAEETGMTSNAGSDKPGPKKVVRSGGQGEGRPVTYNPEKQTPARKRDKPSGAEVIQPQRNSGTTTLHFGNYLAVETLAGYGRARDWALDLKADLQDYLADRLDWAEMSTRLLLSGPPGTGKTTFARALCNTLQVPLVVTSVATWLEGGHLNDVIRKMSKTFEEARELQPCILFVDEIDGIGKRQPAEREYADYWNTVVNRALELLDGAAKSEGVIVVGATNRPMEIDEALRRSGRLETHIEIPRPDIPALADILRFHLGEDIELLKGHQPGGSATIAPLDAESRRDHILDRNEGAQP